MSHTVSVLGAGCVKKENNPRSSLRVRPVGAKKVGDVIHRDFCAHLSSKSLDGSRYFFNFIDEHSGYIRVVPLAKKNGVATQFIDVQRRFERKFECRIKTLQSDTGCEYKALESVLPEKELRSVGQRKMKFRNVPTEHWLSLLGPY